MAHAALLAGGNHQNDGQRYARCENDGGIFKLHQDVNDVFMFGNTR